MNTVGDNSAKVVGLFVFMLILVLLIVAIDNKTVRLLTSIVLVISLVFTVAFMILTKKKNILDKIPTYEERRTIYTMDEGFVIKKAEQGQTSSGEKLNPREEFKELLKKILLLIKKNIVADSVAFYWANEDKKQMVFEEGITDLRFNFVRRYNWDDDALTTVARTGVPKVIGDINSSGSGDVIKYQSPRVESKSLLVFPVFYRNKTVGVILLDSHQAQTFSDDDVKNVELFSELISDLIGNYITKFDLYHKAKILEVISGIEKFDLGDLLERIQNFAIKVLDCSAVAIVLFEEGKWVVAHGYSKLGKYVEAGTEVKIEGTLVGEVIVSGIPKVIPSTRTQGKVYRFTENEKINLESSIAVIPIRYGQKCYGAMLFEHPKLYFFSSHSEIKKLETLANLVGMLLCPTSKLNLFLWCKQFVFPNFLEILVNRNAFPISDCFRNSHHTSDLLFKFCFYKPISIFSIIPTIEASTGASLTSRGITASRAVIYITTSPGPAPIVSAAIIGLPNLSPFEVNG